MIPTTNQAFFITRYLFPTEHRGARIRAKNATSGKAVTVAYDHALSDEQNHAQAAVACYYACALGNVQPTELVRCSTEDASGYIFTTAR